MVDTVAQIFGMTFVGIIMICIGWTIVEYIFGNNKENEKLIENMKKLNKTNKR